MTNLVINLIGAPSVGKSLMSSILFSELKSLHLSSEYIQEYAKKLIYEERFEELHNQYNVSNTQYKLIKAVNKTVKYVVTDGAILLGIYYNRTDINNICNVEKVEKILIDKMNEFHNIYIFLERNPIFPYEINGRNHTFEQSKQIQIELEQLLLELKLPYRVFLSDKSSIKDILEYVLSFTT